MATILIQNEQGEQIEYTLDDLGNAVLDNEIKFTKDQLDSLQTEEPTKQEQIEDPNEDITVDTISLASGISILGEDGNPIAYDMTVESLAQRDKDIKDLGYKEGLSKATDDLFKANPDLYEMFRYKQINGTLEGFSSQSDITSIELNNETNEDTLIDIIYKAEIKKGSSPERAKRLAKFSKDNESLVEDAKESQSYLKSIQTKEEIDYQNSNKARIEAEIKAAEDYFGVSYDNNGKEIVLNKANSLYDIVVTKGTIGEMFIPVDGIVTKQQDGTSKVITRRDIFDYISKPVKEIDGVLYTKAQLDEFERMNNKELAVSQWIKNYLGANSDKLVKQAVVKQQIKIIRNNISSNNRGHVPSNIDPNVTPKVKTPI